MQLLGIQSEVQQRTLHIAEAHGAWPCRKGCADCCRSLASEPQVSEPEWHRVLSAINALPEDAAAAARQRIRESAGRERPVICPLLDADTNACLIYEARPIACRTYGFYSERDKVLGCSQIELSRVNRRMSCGGTTLQLMSACEHLDPRLRYRGGSRTLRLQ
jgi:Fe-S-cluster containining protein